MNKVRTVIPRVTLLGAGPGDEKLITLAGVEALRAADVVMYDALVNPRLLKHASNAKHIFVGKRKGNHKYSQTEINQMLVSQAFECGHVVRLKGGDPFVFGRGSEELAHVEAFGIETQAIPGISSATSVPQRQGIALTQRGIAESFWVVTGTTSQGRVSKDLQLAAQSSATVVLLMAMSNLGEIVKQYTRLGKQNTPVAIIQNGFMENEQVGVGRICTIEDVVERKKLSNPAIVVIGDVVKHSHRLQEIFEQVEHYYLSHE